MSFNKLFELLKDKERDKSIILNVSSGNLDFPFLITRTVSMLEDDSAFCNIISDNNKIALVNMIKSYYESCYEYYSFTDLKLDKILKYGKQEIYKVNAANGLRFATANEVAQGIEGLIAENLYPAGENEFELLSLLQWTFTGKNLYFRDAGYKLTYKDSREPLETTYDMITMSANKLIELFKWCSDSDKVDETIKKLRKAAKSKGFKYASYERDEIEETVTIKQLVYNLDKTLPRKSDNIKYRMALALVIKGKNSISYLTPMDVSFLREIYHQRAYEKDSAKTYVDETLKNECEHIIKERYNGVINQDHFVYKIIDTLKKKNYRFCSAKQYSIISDALSILNKNTDKEKEDKNRSIILDEDDIDKSLGQEDIMMKSLAGISDALGSGSLFGEDEEDD